LLVAIARKRGAVMSGGRIHRQKASELVLTDLRTGALGRLTLETPAEFLAWRTAAEAADAERAAAKQRLKDRAKPQRGQG
jgi:ribosome biogenesis GTPase A